MTAPRRVKVTGDLFHGQIPAGAVYVGRAAPGLKRSRYANPFPATQHGQQKAVRLYSRHLTAVPGLLEAARAELGGRDLACWCGPDQPCHADVLLEAVNNGLDGAGGKTR